MPRKRSAGLLLFRRDPERLRVFLVHPGGPFFASRDEGVWSLPKGEIDEGEDPLRVARREFGEETGQTPETCAGGTPRFLALGSILQRGGKEVLAWAFEGDWPAGASVRSNPFTLEWPPGSGQRRQFPEVDRGALFSLAEALRKIHPDQVELLARLRAALRT